MWKYWISVIHKLCNWYIINANYVFTSLQMRNYKRKTEPGRYYSDAVECAAEAGVTGGLSIRKSASNNCVNYNTWGGGGIFQSTKLTTTVCRTFSWVILPTAKWWPNVWRIVWQSMWKRLQKYSMGLHLLICGGWHTGRQWQTKSLIYHCLGPKMRWQDVTGQGVSLLEIIAYPWVHQKQIQSREWQTSTSRMSKHSWTILKIYWEGTLPMDQIKYRT